MENIKIAIAESKEDLQKFWDLRDEYMIRDVFPFDELGSEITEEDKEWFFSPEYRNYMNSLYVKDKDRAFPVLFIENDVVVGFCAYCTYLSEDGKCFIVDYCILPDYREEGRGTSYFQLLKTNEISRGAKYFELNCSNYRNKHFWENQGFKFTGIDEYGSETLAMYCDHEDTHFKKPVILQEIDETICNVVLKLSVLEE